MTICDLQMNRPSHQPSTQSESVLGYSTPWVTITKKFFSISNNCIEGRILAFMPCIVNYTNNTEFEPLLDEAHLRVIIVSNAKKLLKICNYCLSL